jgi:hypothetical protein
LRKRSSSRSGDGGDLGLFDLGDGSGDGGCGD